MKICKTNNCLPSYPDELNFCSLCGGKLTTAVKPIRTSVYIHSERDLMEEKGSELGLTGDLLTEFSHTGYEIELVIDVDPESGKSLMVGVAINDAELPENRISFLKIPVVI